MCRCWPFIDSVLVDVENWHIMVASCPGIRTDIPADVVKSYIPHPKTMNEDQFKRQLNQADNCS